MDDNAPRNLSRHQYRTLRYIRDHRIGMASLRHAQGNTIGSLAYNDYIRRLGSGEAADVIITQRGADALAAYEQGGMNERLHEGEVTQRCLRLLKHVRRIAETGAA